MGPPGDAVARHEECEGEVLWFCLLCEIDGGEFSSEVVR